MRCAPAHGCAPRTGDAGAARKNTRRSPLARGLLTLPGMTSSQSFGAVVLSFCLTGSICAAGPDARAAGTGKVSRADPAIRVDGVTAPSSVDARTRAALRDAVRERLAGVEHPPWSPGYAVSVSLVQLRRYTGPDDATTHVVCIVDLALRDPHDVLVGSVRGRATTEGTRVTPSLDAAARAAVARVPELVRVAEARSGSSTEVASARR